jgi:hypothetical protein
MFLQSLEFQEPSRMAAGAHWVNVLLGFILVCLGLSAGEGLPAAARPGIGGTLGAGVALVAARTLGRGAGGMALAVALVAAEAALVTEAGRVDPPLSTILVVAALYGAIGCCLGILVGAPPRHYAVVASLALAGVVLARIVSLAV